LEDIIVWQRTNKRELAKLPYSKLFIQYSEENVTNKEKLLAIKPAILLLVLLCLEVLLFTFQTRYLNFEEKCLGKLLVLQNTESY
jgi:hypothetical protein